MNRITCEVCGTAFQDTASCCPICGWSPKGVSPQANMDDVDLGEFDLGEEKVADRSHGRPAGASAQQNRRIFDFDEANGAHAAAADTDDDDTAYYGGQPAAEESRQLNTGLVVVLVVFIALVLLATGILVVKFLLPKKDSDKKETTPPTVIAETVETVPTEEEITEAPTVPCTSLFAPNVETLTAAGEMWRLNVKVSPEDTTDEITYVSENEAVVTVGVDGTLTAVGDGSTNVVITCGSQQVKCPVTVAIETEPPTEATEATEAGEEATEETRDPSTVTLKLNRTDMTFGRLGVSYTLKPENGLTAEEVTWMTSDSSIANVNNGVVTAMGRGVAKITAKYGDQVVTCIVRCKF